ncbi:MAG: type II toxin-antitoxin system RelE/ParE family toxin [Deltaproteobacteria bacterium]|nr:type II toxin-antitoxin system RelE/ParE family toxin [Deltaproteobacteria bacterium]
MSELRRVEWSPVAVTDLEDILDFIARRESPERARLVHAGVARRIASLTKHPLRGRIVPELKRIGVTAFRELVVAPYRIFFRIDGPLVGIVGILDGRRDIADLLAMRGWKV